MQSEDKSSTERFITIAQSGAAPYIRADALHRLGHSGNDDGVNVVVSATSDTAWIVRKQAIISLKYFSSQKAENRLRELANDDNPKNQILAIESLYLSKKDDQLSTVLQFLKSDDPTIRNIAAQTFSFISEKRFLPVLKEALEDETDTKVIMELKKAIIYIELPD